VLPLAIACGTMLGVAAGAIGASGYNLATDLVPPERQGTIAGLVSVVLALGSVAVNVAGGEVLKANPAREAFADGELVSTATGVYLYVLMAGVLFVLAAVPAITLTRNRRAARCYVQQLGSNTTHSAPSASRCGR
jgi:MFS family permease